MARSINDILAQMDAEQALQPGLSGLDSPSQVAIYRLWKYIVSASIWAHEKLWDIFKSELETVADNAQIGTIKWVQSKIFEFQYDATNPQIVQLVNFVPGYDPVDESLRIITRASVKTLPSRIVSIKVAKSDPPEALASSELTSLTGYLNDISFAGVQYNITSQAADELFLEAQIFYNGQYSTVISSTVIDSINNYLSNLPFDGQIRVSSIEDAIQSVPGVTDFIINNLAIRASTVAFGLKTYLVQNNATIYNKYPTISGYVIGETTSGQTFTDKLTFTAE